MKVKRLVNNVCSLLISMTTIFSQIQDSSALSLYYAAYCVRFIASNLIVIDLWLSFYSRSRHIHVKQHSV